MYARTFVSVIALVLAVSGSGCGGDDAPPEGAGCERSEECPDGLVCVLGLCREECTGYRDCPLESACFADEARATRGCRLEPEAQCERHADCGAEGTECHDGRCVATCTTSASCGGTECVAGVCEDPAATRITCEDLAYCGSGICGLGGCDEDVVVAPGEITTCALRASGEVDCAGSDEDGLLGDGPSEPDESPRGFLLPVALDAAAERLAVGARHACVVVEGGEVRCWGRGDRGQTALAGAAELPALAIAAPAEDGGAIEELVLGAHHGCVRRASGAIECWGSDEAGQLGDAAAHAACEAGVACSATPVAVEGLEGVIQLAAGAHATCALHEDGTVSCWGRADGGLAGDPSVGTESCTVDGMAATCRPTPAAIAGIEGATAIAVGAGHACAIVTDGVVRCWGADDAGQAGGEIALPMAAVALGAGAAHACALLADDRVWCWGGAPVAAGAPAEVAELPPAFDVVSGTEHACARTFDGETWCWGRNAEAQLARGEATAPARPGRALRSPPGGP